MFKIVTVDDEKMIKRSMRKLIECTDPSFIITGEATNGREALELIVLDPPQLLITDICMPVMNGLELIAEVKMRYPATEIVVISGYSEFNYAQQAIRYGVTDYLLKPLQTDEFIQVLGRIHERFKKRSKRIADRGQLLTDFYEESDRILKEIWTLKESGLLEQLNRMEAAWRELDVEADLRKELYVEQLIYVMNKLEEKSGHAFLQLDALQLLQMHAAEDVHEQFKQICLSLQKEAGSFRNLGQGQQIQKTIPYIDANFANCNLSLIHAAEKAGMSVTYFSRIFKQETGVTFMKYLTNLRMSKAKQLLAQADSKVGEVALSVGYTNYHHFAKAFRNYNGMTPTEYKKLNPYIG